MELREKEVAADQICAGWPSLSEIGKRMIIWVTPYQRDFARYPLTLHTGDLPLQTDEAREQLRAFVDEVLCHAPALPSHIDHPQWNYHSRAFIETRHKKLSARLGSATADSPPPENLSEIDKTWWKLDGLAKSYLRRRTELTELMDQERDLVRQARARLEEDAGRCGEKLFAKLLALKPDANYSGMVPWCEWDGSRRTEGAVIGNPARSNYAPWVSAIADYEAEYQNEQKIEQRRLLTRITEFIDKSEETQLQSLELEFEAARRELQKDYDTLIPKSIESAAPREAAELEVVESAETSAVAAIEGGEAGALASGETGAGSSDANVPPAGEETLRQILIQGPITHAAESYSAPIFIRPAKMLYRYLFGRVPRVRMLHPYWATLRHVIRLVDRAIEDGARNVVTIGSGPVDGIADHLAGMHARLSVAEAVGRNLGKDFNLRPEFELCICSLTIPELSLLPEIMKAVTPYMRVGARIIIFLSNINGGRSPSSRERASAPAMRSGVLEPNYDLRNDTNVWRALGELSDSAEMYFAGGARSVRMLQRLHGVRSSSYLKRLLMFLAIIAPQAIAANREEAATTEAEQSSCPTSCTSITIEISIRSPQSEAEMPIEAAGECSVQCFPSTATKQNR
jgi:hypothetical protein